MSQVDRNSSSFAWCRPWAVCVVILPFLIPTGCEPQTRYDRNVKVIFGETGMGDGEFSYPRAVAVAPDGAVFVVDKTARIQRFNPDGEFELSWRMPEWKKGKPVGLAVHPDGRVFVPDTHYSRVMIYNRDGKHLDQFGEHGEGDGQFLLPTDIAFDSSGMIYVGEYGGNDRISVFTPEFAFVRSFGGPDSGKASLARPAGLLFDEQDRLWVADAVHHRICCFSKNGKLLSTFGSVGTDVGQLKYPYDIARLPNGSLLVCEFANNRLQWFSPTGRSLGVWGTSGRESGRLAAPWGVDVGSDGRIYIVDAYNNRVQVIRL